MYKRREFLKLIGGSILGALLPKVAAGAQGKKQYNVLLICVDDLRPQLGCFGHKEMISPNIDRLADEGRLFTRHYVQSAVCGPSRCTMLTGRMKWTWDCWVEARKLKTEPKEPTSFAHLFHRNGYRTVCIGKVSHQPGGVLDKEQKVYQVPFSWDLAFAPVGEWRTPWRAFFSYDKGKAYNKIIRMEKDEPRLPYESADVSDTGYADGLNAEAAVKQLGDLKKRGGPFLLAVGLYKPHLPFNAPKKYWDLYDREKIGTAKNNYPPKNVDPNISIHNSFEVTTHYLWPSGAGNISEEEAKKLRHGYCACVSYVDAQIGKVLDEVKRLGLEDNTIVALWSDHGWHLGEHGMFGKQTNFDIATRSPLIIKVPGMESPGKRGQGLVETLDVYPTLAELCGLEVPEDLQGQSQVAMLRDPEQPGKEWARSYHPRGRINGRALKTEQYRIVRWTDKQGEIVQVELYDHKNDPDENVNVVAEREEVVKELLAKMPRAFEGL